MKHYKKLIFVLMLAMFMPLFTVTAFAAESYGFEVTASSAKTYPGETVDVTVSLTGYTEQAAEQEKIIGVQVDISDVDTDIITVESRETLIDYAPEDLLSNTVSYNEADKYIRLLYIDDTDVLPAPCEGILKVRFKVNSEITETGSITLPVTVKMVTTVNAEITLDGSITINYGPETITPGTVVKIGDTEYTSLSTALSEAQTGDTVKLVADAEEIIVMVTGGATLDLNGHTLTADYVVVFNDGNNIVDNSLENTGLLAVDSDRFVVARNNAQLPVKTTDGYKFYEVLKINEKAYTGDQYGKYVFQPFIETAAHEELKKGMANTDVKILVDVSYQTEDGKTGIREFLYSDNFVNIFIDSYKPDDNKYGQMFTLTIDNASKYPQLAFTTRVVFADKVEFASPLA